MSQPQSPIGSSALPRRMRRWLLPALAALALLGLTGAAIVEFRTDHSQVPAVPAGAAPPIAAGVLPSLLSSPGDIAAAVGAESMTSTISADQAGRFYVNPIVDDQCVAVVYPATDTVYRSALPTAVRNRYLRDPADGPPRLVAEESVIRFASAGAAQNFYDRSTDTWKRCAQQTLDVSPVDDPDAVAAPWTVGEVEETGRVVSTTLTERGGDGWACRRALAVDLNVISEVRACGYDLPDAVPSDLIEPVRTRIQAHR